MLTERTVTTFTAACDGPPSCPTRPIQTPTEVGLVAALKGQGWRLAVVDGKIDRTQPIYCKACTAALQAAGKLGA